MTEPQERERSESEAVKQKRTFLTTRLMWCGNAWNASPEQAAQQTVADLYEHLSRGGTVSVRIEDSGGKEHTLEVGAR